MHPSLPSFLFFYKTARNPPGASFLILAVMSYVYHSSFGWHLLRNPLNFIILRHISNSYKSDHHDFGQYSGGPDPRYSATYLLLFAPLNTVLLSPDVFHILPFFRTGAVSLTSYQACKRLFCGRYKAVERLLHVIVRLAHVLLLLFHNSTTTHLSV